MDVLLLTLLTLLTLWNVLDIHQLKNEIRSLRAKLEKNSTNE